MLSTYINIEKEIAVYYKDYMNEFVCYKHSDNLELSFLACFILSPFCPGILNLLKSMWLCRYSENKQILTFYLNIRLKLIFHVS